MSIFLRSAEDPAYEINREFLCEDVNCKRGSCKFHHSPDLLGHSLNGHEVADLVSKVVEHGCHVMCCKETGLDECGVLPFIVRGLVDGDFTGRSDIISADSGCHQRSLIFSRKLILRASPTGIEVLPQVVSAAMGSSRLSFRCCKFVMSGRPWVAVRTQFIRVPE